MTRTELCHRIFWAFAALHVVAWTTLSGALMPSLPPALAEMLALGREWQPAYPGRPPLGPWLVELAFGLGGKWGVLLAVQLAVGVAAWTIWRLARAMGLGPVRAVAAALALELIYGISLASPTLAAPALLYPFWGGALWLAWRLRHGLDEPEPESECAPGPKPGAAPRMAAPGASWAGLGLVAALGFLVDYAMAGLLLALFAGSLMSREGRRLYAGGGPWLAAFIALPILLIHLIPLAGGEGGSGSAAADGAATNATAAGMTAARWLAPARVLGWGAVQAVPVLLVAGLLGRGTGGRQPPAGPAWRFARGAILGPALIALAATALWPGIEPLQLAAPILLPLGLVAMFWRGAADPQPPRWRAAAVAWGALAMGALIAFAGELLIAPAWRGHGAPSQRPAWEFAQNLSAQWQARAPGRVPALIGPAGLAGQIAAAMPARPPIQPDADPARAPWLNDARIRNDGALAIWLGPDHGREPQPLAQSPLADLRARFPGLETGPPLTADWQVPGTLPPVTLNWAYIPPLTPPAMRRESDAKTGP